MKKIHDDMSHLDKQSMEVNMNQDAADWMGSMEYYLEQRKKGK